MMKKTMIKKGRRIRGGKDTRKTNQKGANTVQSKAEGVSALC